MTEYTEYTKEDFDNGNVPGMETYETAKSVARDLAVNYIASEMGYAHIANPKSTAIKIREESEKNNNDVCEAVSRYREVERVIYSAMADLLDGDTEYEITIKKKNASK